MLRNMLCCIGGEQSPNRTNSNNTVLNTIPNIKNGKLHDQNFRHLHAACLTRGTLYQDLEFPPTNKSLYFSKDPPCDIEWRRASEISKNAQFFVDGPSRFDINQGRLGDCWLLAAISSLAMKKDLLYKVVPADQSFNRNYAGIFHFSFYQYGRWVDVVVDDYLPTHKGSLVYMKSKPENEFWASLLEKAYAKLNGSYEALEGGMMGEALTDLTGGVSELFSLKTPDCPSNLFQIMLDAYKYEFMMGCSILGSSTNKIKRLGLLSGHAYTITKVICANVTPSRGYKTVCLVRIRNPWGNKEWRGRWSDGSPEWMNISDVEKQRIGLTFDDKDGEFYMTFDDFKKYFTHMEMCNPLYEVDMEVIRHDFRIQEFKGSWIQRQNAGGCRNFAKSFATNPQFRIRIKKADDGDAANFRTIVVSLMQKGRRGMREDGLGNLKIGFEVYHILNPALNRSPLNSEFFRNKRPEQCYGNSKEFDDLREIVGRYRLYPGSYVIVPSTYAPGKEGDFFLRILSQKDIVVE